MIGKECGGDRAGNFIFFELGVGCTNVFTVKIY